MWGFFMTSLKGNWGKAVFGLPEHLAMLFQYSVGKEDAIEVIDLVLDVSRLDVFVIYDLFRDKVFQFYRVRPVYETPDLGDGKATFEPAIFLFFVNSSDHLFTHLEDFWIDKNFGGLASLVEEDEEPFVQTHLGGGQTNSFGVYRLFEDRLHLFHFFGCFFVPDGKRLGLVLEEGVGSSQDLHTYILPCLIDL